MWRCAARSRLNSCSSIRTGPSNAIDSVMRSCRRQPTTGCSRPSGGVLHAAYARAIETATGRCRGRGLPPGSSRSLITGVRRRTRPAPSGAAIAAGDASRAVYAYAEAGRQYERAIELWDLVPAADRPTDRDLADLFEAASATATLVGDASHAVDLSQSAIELIDADSADDRGRRARARERFGYASWLAGDTATSIRLLEEAIDLLDGASPSTDEARVLAGLAGNLMLAGRCAESVPFAERAIESARTAGAQAIEDARAEHPGRRPCEPRQHRGRDRSLAAVPRDRP